MRKGIFLLLSLLVLFAQVGLAGDFTDKLGLGFAVGGQRLYGDAETGYWETGGSPLVFRFNVKPSLYFESGITYSGLSTSYFGYTLGTSQLDVNFRTGYRLMKQTKLNPLLFVGIGMFNYELVPGTRYSDAYGAVGAGAEYFLTNHLSGNFTADQMINIKTVARNKAVNVGLSVADIDVYQPSSTPTAPNRNIDVIRVCVNYDFAPITPLIADLFSGGSTIPLNSCSRMQAES